MRYFKLLRFGNVCVRLLLSFTVYFFLVVVLMGDCVLCIWCILHASQIYFYCTHNTTYLKPSHIPGIASIFQTILVTFHKELQEEPENRKHNIPKHNVLRLSYIRTQACLLDDLR